MTTFPIMECTIRQVQQAMLEGKLTCRELTEAYLARMEAYVNRAPPSTPSLPSTHGRWRRRTGWIGCSGRPGPSPAPCTASPSC